MKAALRQEISDRLAELAVDQFEDFLDDTFSIHSPNRPHPEDLLELQHKLEDVLYRELDQWQ